mgnify:CR=1 FL=1
MANPAPSSPTPANVAGTATQPGALDASELNLLGLFGTQQEMRALVRLPNGRVKTLRRGSRLARSKVLNIDAEGLLLQRGSDTRRIAMPGK